MSKANKTAFVYSTVEFPAFFKNVHVVGPPCAEPHTRRVPGLSALLETQVYAIRTLYIISNITQIYCNIRDVGLYRSDQTILKDLGKKATCCP
jgi:hypothetical protein